MGACASKPKVLKTDMDAAPELTISKEVKTTSPAAETREIVLDEKNKVDQVQEEEEKIPKVDDVADKRQSLGVLLQETEGKDSSSDNKTQIETAQAEPVKEVVPTVENVPAVEIVEIRTEDTTPVPAVVTSETVKTENPAEVIPAVESEKLEKSEEKGTTEEKLLTTPKADIEKPIEVAPVVQSVKAVQVETTETKPVVESVKADQVEKAETTAVAATENTVVVAPPVVSTTEKTVEAAPPVVAATEKTVEVAPTKADVVEEKTTEIAPATEKTIEVAPPVETAKIGEVVVKEADKVSTIEVRPEESVSSVASAEKVAGEVS